MKKKILGLTAAVLMLCGCGKVPVLSNGEEAVVTFNNGDGISVNDLYNELKDDYALMTLITMIDTKVLEDSFPDYVETAKANAESYMKVIRANYDSDDDLLSDIQSYTGLSTIEAYQNYMYLSYMQSYAATQYAKTLVTDKEINNYYKNNIVGDIEVSHILITPEVTDTMTDEEKSAAEDAALTKAQSILDSLKKSNNLSEDFATYAAENSDDDSTKDNGGSLGRINKSTLSSSYDDLVNAAYSIKDGELYGSVVKTSLGYHVIYRTASYDKASLEDSKESIISTLADEKVSESSTIGYEALDYYRKELGMEIEDDTLKKQYSYYMQNLLTQDLTNNTTN